MSIPDHYIPESLSPEDKARQIQLIKKSRRDYKSKKPKYVIREKLKSHKNRKSGHVADFKRRYPHIRSMADLKGISREFNIPPEDLERILNKGRGAYFSSGSRPNQTPDSWAHARLASSLLGRRACRVDRHILREHNITCQQLKDKYKPDDETDENVYYGPDKQKGSRKAKRKSRNRNNRQSSSRKTRSRTKSVKCKESNTPYPIIKENVALSYFKGATNPVKKIKDSVRSYMSGQHDKIYGKRFGVASLKAMGLIPRSNGKYNITSTTKPYCENYHKYMAKKNKSNAN
jgi:hypothetical protein